MTNHQHLVSIELLQLAFQKISHSLTALSADELAKLISDDYTCTVQIKKKTRAKTSQSANLAHSSPIAPMLMQCATRDDALSLLIKHCKLKRDLETLARELDIAISKKDRIADLRDKIVDATVGAKLRSAAIQNI